jgi:DeoR/GlpR family transcriptional regulator of sugar metabolism
MSAETGGLFVKERRREILERLRARGRVSVRDLSRLMGVSTVTIRQDLRSLEAAGLLERTHGGAVLPQSKMSGPELSFDIRMGEHQDEKEAIARLAAGMVQSGMSIALDASTTAFAMVPYLKHLRPLIVVTNSLSVAHGFLDTPHITVHMPGGRLRRDSVALVGRINPLPEINLNFGFFGARGISSEAGITDSDPDEVGVKRALMARCLRTVIVAGADKWDRVAPYEVAALGQVHVIVTGPGAPESLVALCRGLGVDVVMAPVEVAQHRMK